MRWDDARLVRPHVSFHLPSFNSSRPLCSLEANTNAALSLQGHMIAPQSGLLTSDLSHLIACSNRNPVAHALSLASTPGRCDVFISGAAHSAITSSTIKSLYVAYSLLVPACSLCKQSMNSCLDLSRAVMNFDCCRAARHSAVKRLRYAARCYQGRQWT
jgi:hypothetical protein